MQIKYKTYEDEYELRCLEKELAAELKVPYVRCGYDSSCSHISSNEELEYRREENLLGKDEYIINYEIYNTEESRDDIYTGGIDGEVHELIYTATDGNYILVKKY